LFKALQLNTSATCNKTASEKVTYLQTLSMLYQLSGNYMSVMAGSTSKHPTISVNVFIHNYQINSMNCSIK